MLAGLIGRRLATLRPVLLSLKLRIWAAFGRTTSPPCVDPKSPVQFRRNMPGSGLDCHGDSPTLSHQRPASLHFPRRDLTVSWVQSANDHHVQSCNVLQIHITYIVVCGVLASLSMPDRKQACPWTMRPHATPCYTAHAQAGDCGVTDTPKRKAFPAGFLINHYGAWQSSRGYLYMLVTGLLTLFCYLPDTHASSSGYADCILLGVLWK
jgi:hypothetical protein